MSISASGPRRSTIRISSQNRTPCTKSLDTTPLRLRARGRMAGTVIPRSSRLSFPVRHVGRAGFLTAAFLLLAGCSAPLTTEHLTLPESYRQLNRSALSSDTVSDSTLIVLRRHDLL